MSRKEAKTAAFFFLSFLFSSPLLIWYWSPDTGQIFHSALRTDADWSPGQAVVRGAREGRRLGVSPSGDAQLIKTRLPYCGCDEIGALIWKRWHVCAVSGRAACQIALRLVFRMFGGVRGIVRVCLLILVQLYYRKSEQFYGGWIDCLCWPRNPPPKNLTAETFVSVQHSAAPNPFPVSRVKLLSEVNSQAKTLNRCRGSVNRSWIIWICRLRGVCCYSPLP